MASFTRYYNLGYFDFGEELGTNYAVQVEKDRWVLLDKLLLGLMTSIGSNGIIEGWKIQTSQENKLAIQVDSGRGHINNYSAYTEFPIELVLDPNNIFYIYAIRTDVTAIDEDANFISSIFPINNDDHLLIGIVTTGAVSVETIDISVRQEIQLIEQIKEKIRQHRHRGGTLHPSKIDLQTDVKGQLPSFRIEDFDASKITTGTVDLVRLPLISHNLLQNIGQLTHPQLESFIKTLEVSNKELFGEISTSNMLQQHILMKYLYDDPDSPFYMANGPSDKDYLNEFTIIPGISPESFLDRENTTAIIDTELREIRGVPPVQGSTYFITYDTDLAWNSAYLMTNVSALNDTVALVRDTSVTGEFVIENFENSTGDNELLSDGTIFTKEIINLNPDGAQIVSESNELNVAEGAFSALVTNTQAFRLQFVKQYETAQDWSNYDSFLIDVKTEKSPHGPVSLYFVNSNGDESPHFVLLESNELTSNNDNRGFETRIIDISSLSFSNDIKKIVIYVDDLTNPFKFFIDSLVLQRAILLPEEGKLVIRYSSSVPVVFSVLDWIATEPTGTSLRVRARAANGTVLLSRSSYTPFLNSGERIDLNGTDLEIEIIFLSDPDKIYAPTLSRMRITILSTADVEGFTIDETTELTRGSTENTQIVPAADGKADVSLQTPIYVGSHYFALGKTIQQNFYGESDSNNPHNISEIALFGKNTPISPNYIMERISKDGPNITVQSSSFFDPKNVVRLTNRNFLIADTFNDRILEMNANAQIVNGFGSINYTFEKLFPIASCIDLRSGILYVVWSRSIPFKVVNVNRLTIRTATTEIPLRDNYDKPFGYTKAELQNLNIEGQIMAIHLMDQNFALVKNITEDAYLSVGNDIIEGGIDATSVYYRSIKTIGIPCFLGNFAYKIGINAPTYVNKTLDNGYTIANATYAVKEFQVPDGVSETLTRTHGFTDIIELDENGDSIWGSPTNWVKFSPFVPGRAQQIDQNTLVLAGIKPTGEQEIENPEDLTFTSLSGDETIRNAQKAVLKSIFENMNGTAGVIIEYNTTGWAYIVGPYNSAENVLISDADIDQNGYLTVAESSFDKFGRIIAVDNFGNVNSSWGENLLGQVNGLSISQNTKTIST